MYIIDGHNLIPKIPGLSLADMDDEMSLVEMLQTYARARGKRDIEVYFDGAPAGQAGVRVFGMIRAHFVASGMTADEAIRRCLVGLGRQARNATVVSSDRQVQANARSAQAKVVRSENFALELLTVWAEHALTRKRTPAKKAGEAPTAPETKKGQPVMKEKPGTRTNQKQPGMSDRELQDWLDLFGIDPQQADQPIEPPESSWRPKKWGKGKRR
jgi:uncharacterized protein